VPTHKEEPWERDRRAIEEREARRTRGYGALGAPGRLELSSGGREKASVRHRGVFLSSPRQRAVVWVLLGGGYLVTHHSVLGLW
jgi:hypothetical protein